MNDAVLAKDYLLYTGSYAGKIYLQDAATTYADASEASPGTINAFWRSGWMDIETMLEGKTFPCVELNYKTQATGNFNFSYGFDFSEDRHTEPVSMTSPGAKYDAAMYDVDVYGGQTDRPHFIHTKGRGKFLQWRIQHTGTIEPLYFNGLEMPVKTVGVMVQR